MFKGKMDKRLILVLSAFVFACSWAGNVPAAEINSGRVISTSDFITSGKGTAAKPWSAQAIQKAINALGQGGEVLIRSGYYTLDETTPYIKVMYNNITLRGEGPSTVIVPHKVLANPIQAMGKTGLRFLNFKFDGKNLALNGIILNSVKDFVVEGLVVENIKCDKTGAGDGILIFKSSDGYVTRNTVRRCTGSTGANAGIEVTQTSKRIIVSNNFCSENRYGIAVFSHGPKEVLEDIIITGNIVKDNYAKGIQVMSVTPGCFKGVIVSDNIIRGKAEQGGFIVSGMEDAKISNNLVFDTTFIVRETKNSIIEGNLVRSSLSDGIAIFKTTGSLIEGNLIYNSAKNGLFLSECQGNLLTGNLIKGNRANGIYLFNSSSNIVKNNYLKKNAKEDIFKEESPGNIIE